MTLRQAVAILVAGVGAAGIVAGFVYDESLHRNRPVAEPTLNRTIEVRAKGRPYYVTPIENYAVQYLIPTSMLVLLAGAALYRMWSPAKNEKA